MVRSPTLMPNILPYPARKPYIRPVIEPRPERAKMTIAMGFTFKDGILLCADTEQTWGDFKFGESKIVSEKLSQANVAFAISGSVHNARMAIEEILKDSRKSDQSQNTFEEIIKNRIADIYTRLLYPHPAAGYGTPFFDLLIAIWADGNLRLLATSETAVTEVTAYECRGIGLTLAKYLIEPLYTAKLNGYITTRIALRTLAHVKKYVSGCGGKSEMLLINSGGELTPIKAADLSIQANLMATLDDISAGMFFATSDLEMSDDDLGPLLDLWKSIIIGERQKARLRANLDTTQKREPPTSDAST
jgi:20S proteasome alpha/beta subunit